MTKTSLPRLFYADLVAGKGGSRDQHIRDAFAAVERERFCGPGPWRVYTEAGYIDTPSDDPVFLYQDILIGLVPERMINSGEPSLHARCLEAIGVRPGETVVHVGAGTGYYTALLAHITGPAGSVVAYEIDAKLAERARLNLTGYANVLVQARSGSEGAVLEADVIYVNAGATEPLPNWLDALRPGGRLIFPLTPDEDMGGMLLVTRKNACGFDARFVSDAMFTPCIGGRNPSAALRLAAAYRRGDHFRVRSLRRSADPDHTCWVSGRNWWLSTADPETIGPVPARRGL